MTITTHFDPPTGLSRDIESKPLTLQLGSEILLQISSGKQIQDDDLNLGIRDVWANGIPLRSPIQPMFAQIATPDGIRLMQPRILNVTESPAGTAVQFGFSRDFRGNEPMEWQLHTVRSRVNTRMWGGPPQPIHAGDTLLTLHLKPIEYTIRGRRAVGFSYQYVYESQSFPIYKLTDRATWEPGGRAVGCELWFRCPFTRGVRAFTSLDEAHSTEWYLPEARNPNIFQFLPLQTACQGFTMTAAKQGVLLTLTRQASHIRTLIEKHSGDDTIAHWHEHCSDLSNELATAPMEVLWIAGATDMTERINIYESVRDLVSKAVHTDAGLREDRVTSYGVIEEWISPDLPRFTRDALPKFEQAGVKTLMVCNYLANNMSEYGLSNMCCTVDWRISEAAGEANMIAFCHEAAHRGMRIEMWGNTALSSIAYQEFALPQQGAANRLDLVDARGTIWPKLAKAEDPWMRNPTGAIEADHYAPVFVCLNLRDASVASLWSQTWRDLHDRVGIGGIFLDSSFNLSSDKFHWVANAEHLINGATADQTHLHGRSRPHAEAAPASKILTQYHAHLALVRDMQGAGFTYAGEDNGLFGVNRGGPSCVRAAPEIHLWGNAILTFNPDELLNAGFDPDDIFFRGLAFRVMWFLFWQPDVDRLSWCNNSAGHTPAMDPSIMQLALLRVFNQVESMMHYRTLTSDGRAVIYRAASEDRCVVWALDDFMIPEGHQATMLHGAQSDDATLLRHSIAIIAPNIRGRNA